ncbi:bifunctional glycosyltransferase family 2 protein/CDP-glycerol:glycerophosphate glycerophosphotransferase [Exiguobacterium sp.]|uniref:bifunctional glycosyltransferase/CDP-glycerol:glycerophosphate glycerophosphotransferase n=1 Tax=Exiguobacterium sp. TaxID=44751 RepID=UPI0028B09987|nr:bifunctional glycosyltransferase family 2 protein/CDP-glycerol:glycerophosphate glycerophosphotransferase [Exiguobacterium sp.]
MNSISVIIPVYQTESQTKAAIQSVLDQKVSIPVEIIVVFDGPSTYIDELRSLYPTCTFLEQAHQGTYAARRRGLEVATGDYVTFLDSDDILAPRALYTYIKAYEKSRGEVIIGKVSPVYNKKKWLMPIDDDRYFFYTRTKFNSRHLTTIHGWMIKKDFYGMLSAHTMDNTVQKFLNTWYKRFISKRGRALLERSTSKSQQADIFRHVAYDLRQTKTRSKYLQAWSTGSYFMFRSYITAVKTKRTLRTARRKKIKNGLVLYRLFQKMPVKENLVLFESFLGRSYSDNPKALYLKLKEQRPELELVWIFSKEPSDDVKEACPNWVLKNSFAYYQAMARAKYWIFNTRQPLSLKKREETIYLQTWHGTPLKRLGLDMEEVHMAGTNATRYKRNFYNQAQEWNYLISPNAYSSEIFKSAFGFQNTMLETGYPRNDLLYADDQAGLISEIKARLDIPADKKVVLYAPTWRDDEFIARGKYRFDLQLNLNEMQARLGDDYVVLLRMHYLIAQNMDISGHEGFAYDVSSYGDIAELYLISDVLITDYSSVFFDYAHLQRPMIFFTYDLEKYASTLRGFYFDFEAVVPGPLLKETDQVIDYIEQIDTKSVAYQEKYDRFLERFCSLDDGTASERVLAELFPNASSADAEDAE